MFLYVLGRHSSADHANAVQMYQYGDDLLTSIPLSASNTDNDSFKPKLASRSLTSCRLRAPMVTRHSINSFTKMMGAQHSLKSNLNFFQKTQQLSLVMVHSRGHWILFSAHWIAVVRGWTENTSAKLVLTWCSSTQRNIQLTCRNPSFSNDL